METGITITQVRELSQPFVKVLATFPVVSDTPYDELYKMDDVSISSVNKGTGSKNTGIAIFAAAMYSVINFFGDEGWSDAQIIETAEIFYDECYWFCLPELKHFTRKCKALKFGKVYGKFTPAVFMEWVSTYSTEAFEKRESHFRNKLKTVSNWTPPKDEDLVATEVIKSKLQEFEAEIALINEKEQEEAKERIKESTAMRKKIDEYMDYVKKTTPDA